MKLPLQIPIGLVMVAFAGGMVTADPDPQVKYVLTDPVTGESQFSDDPFGTYLRSDDPVVVYDALEGIDIDGDNANFATEYPPIGALMDDYTIAAYITEPQALVTHSFRAGFGGSGSANGLLNVRFLDEGFNEVSSYLVNLTGQEGFFNYVISLTSYIPLPSTGYVEFEWDEMDPPNTRFGIMEAEPQLGSNRGDVGDFLTDEGFNVDISGAFMGISQSFTSVEIPSPGSLAPLALAGIGLFSRRRKH
ncbi:MAG: hypothetical protein KAS72_14865 [Phycisphaerales bacterium]|nr:hypothetical protein [Phycisphaerales bacterium]